MTERVVVGYGSDLRSDDAAGRCVAHEVQRVGPADVKVCSVSQLTPELALDLAGAGLVVFVDASVDDDEVTVRPVSARPQGPGTMTHHGDPAALLSMVEAVGEVPAKAFVVSVPASNLELGFKLSPQTEVAVDQAVIRVLELLNA